MADIAVLGLRVDASGAIVATRDLGTALNRLGRQGDDTATRLEKSMRRGLAFVGGAAALRILQQTADSYTLLSGRLGLVAGSTQELEQVQAELFRQANENRQALVSTAETYARMAMSARQLGIDQETLLRTNDAIGKSLLVSGTSASSANAALIQFSQGLSAGVLRGEELNSVLEQAPRLAMAVADGLNVPTSALRKLGEAGLLTSERVLGALQSQLPKLAQEAERIPTTIGQALTVLNNVFGAILSGTDKATGATSILARAVIDGAEWMLRYRDAVAAVGVALGVGGLVAAAGLAAKALIGVAGLQVLQAWGGYVLLIRSMTDAMVVARAAAAGLWSAVTGPVGLAIAAVTAVAGAFYLWRKNAREAADATRAAMDETAIGGTRADQIAATPFEDLSGEYAKLKNKGSGSGSGDALRDAADRVRLAQQALALTQLTADAAAMQQIHDKAINDTLRARATLKGAELAATLRAITEEERLALKAERNRQAQEVSQRGTDRVRAARQAAEMVGLEGEAAERLRIEHEALNALVEARRRLSGDNLAIEERSIEAARQIALAASEAENIRRRSKSRAEQQRGIDGMVREIDLLNQQAAALRVSRTAYEELRIDQAAAAAVAQAYNDAKAKGITLSDADAKRIGDLTRQTERARGEVEHLLNVDGVRFTDSLRDALGLVQGISAAFGETGRRISTIVAGASQLVQALERASEAGKAGSAAGSGGMLATLTKAAGVIGPLVGISVGIFTRGREALAQERAAAEAEVTKFEAAMARFSEALTGLSGSVEDQLDAINKAEAEALAAARQRAAEIQRRQGDQINLTGNIPGEAQAARARVGSGFMADLSRQLVEVFASSVERDIMRLQEEANARVATARRLLDEGALSQEAYNQALASSATIRDRLIAQIREEEAARQRAADEARRRSIEDDRFRAMEGVMPRRELDDLRFAAEQARELFDLIASGADDATVAARRLALAAAAAQRAAERAEADARTRESLISRIYGGMGNSAVAEQVGMDARQRQELVDAVRDGMSESNLTLLRFAQQIERAQAAMERAIAEQTAAVEADYTRTAALLDAQIAAIRTLTASAVAALDAQIEAVEAAADAADQRYAEQLDVLGAMLDVQRDALRAAESSLRVNTQALESLRGFSDSLTFSTSAGLSPVDQLETARAEYERVLRLAEMGNADAAGQLPEVARRFLELSREVNASGPQYARDFAAVREAVARVSQVFEGAVGRDSGTVQALTTQIARTEDTIRAVTAAREQARADAERQITALRELRERVQADAQRQIDALEAQKVEARANADRQIEVIRAVEEAVFRSAVEASEYYAAWRAASAGLDELTRTASERANDYYDHVRERDRDPIRVDVPPDPRVDEALTAARVTNERLEAAIAVIGDGLMLVAEKQEQTTEEAERNRTAIRQGFETLSAALAALSR